MNRVKSIIGVGIFLFSLVGIFSVVNEKIYAKNQDEYTIHVVNRKSGKNTAYDVENTENRDIVNKVGKVVSFKILDIKDNKVILSRKKAQEECTNNYISKLKAGDIVKAKITDIKEFGAFCDIGCGVEGLLPVKLLCMSKIIKMTYELNKIQSLYVVIKEIGDNGKIGLSLKELLGTWEQEASKFNVGDVAIGIVRNITDYGVFVELTPNLSVLAEVPDNLNIKYR